MSSPAELVTQTFARAEGYASAATAALGTYLSAMTGLNYSAPTVSVTWNSIAPPALPDLPSAPTLPTVEFEAPSTPGAFSGALPTVVIDDFSEAAPEIEIGVAPTVAYGAVPAIPSIGDITTPSAPNVTMPTAPSLLTLASVTLDAIDLRAEWLDELASGAPTLTLVAPTPYSYTRGDEYVSELLSLLGTKFVSIINDGGTSLSAAAEAAIWNRAREREQALALANEAEVLRSSDALGFGLPSGVIAMQLRQAQQDGLGKASSLSRDIAVKQAEMEQDNMKLALQEGVKLEGQLVDYSYKLEQLTFESAKTAAENAVATYNAAVTNYQALVEGYKAFASAYQTVINGQNAIVEIYKAQLQAEQTKAQINSTLVEQYRVGIEAGRIQVEIYNSQVQAARTLVDIEKTKIEAAGEQIRAYTAQVNAETSKVEAYKAQVGAQQAIAEIYRIKTQAYSAKVSGQAEKARVLLAELDTALKAKALEWDGYKAQIEGERARITALAAQSGVLVDGYKAAALAIEAKANSTARLWETQIKDYEASQNVSLTAAKMNTEAFLSTRQAQQDTAKVGAQVYAQLTSSAYTMTHAQAHIQGSGETSVSYQYRGEVSSDVSPMTSA